MARLPEVTGITPTAPVDLSGVAGIGARAQASLFAEIAQSAAQLRSQLQPVLDQQAERQAQERVSEAFDQRADDDSTLPDLELRRAWTRQDQIYNNAVTAGALARAGIDAEQEATRLRERFSNDPGGFEQAYTAFVSNYIENAPPEIAQEIELDMTRQFGREQSRIAERTRINALNEQEEALTLRLAHLDEEARSLILENGIGSIESEDYRGVFEEYRNVVSILVDNPAFGHSAEWGADQLENFGTRSRESVLLESVREIYDEGGIVGAMEFIDGQRDDLNVSEQDWIGLRSRLVGEVNMLQNIDSARRADRRRQDEIDGEHIDALGRDFLSQAIEMSVSGDGISEDWLTLVPDMVRIGAITEAQARQYIDASNGAIPENDQLVVSYENLARTGSVSMEDLRGAMNPLLGRGLNSDSYRRILDLRETFDDERLGSGVDMIEAAFGQSEFDFDFDNSQAVMEQEAISELDQWLEQNPDATRFDARRQATLIAIRMGRDVGAPPAPRGGAPDVTSTLETFEEWESSALDVVIERDEAGEWASDAEREAYRNRLESYRQWWLFQNNLTQMERRLNNAQ